MLIELHDLFGNVTLVNIGLLACIRVWEEHSLILFQHGVSTEVKETPEEIHRLIKQIVMQMSLRAH